MLTRQCCLLCVSRYTLLFVSKLLLESTHSVRILHLFLQHVWRSHGEKYTVRQGRGAQIAGSSNWSPKAKNKQIIGVVQFSLLIKFPFHSCVFHVAVALRA
ncbi:hypothetical protein HBI56_004680 [Parastagonospora nodorum]|nr:hypothetical protein HBH56_125000 [Parastagonospora nodorum]KAH3934716.1 hypothetical protein HBH54_050540 [Parastagonospora nodorum]KAH3950351.1 hypothetical protein HBH53_078820 [Parastagonospora nodorum]KAH3972407.1 hypothetical protein HBH52_153710 [Parastagonospora nodorum]KAH3982682.1 hypothetical protein HBH51_036590 [Parastagonospora nodorum]